MQQRVQAVAGQASEAVENALHPAERVLPQREVMLGDHVETRLPQHLAQRGEREMVEMAREVEVKPRGAGPARLRALEVRDGDDHAAARFEDPVHLLERSARVVHVLEDVPDDHLVEGGLLVPRVCDLRRDPDLRPRVGAARRFGADLHAVHLEAPVGQRSEEHAATAADVEHPRAGREVPGEESDVARPDQANEAFDQGLELRPRLAVVFVRIERTHFLRPRTGMKAAESTLNADHDGRRHARDREPRSRLLAVADGTGRYALRRVGRWIERLDGKFVETCAGQGKPLLRMKPMDRAVPAPKGQGRTRAGRVAGE